MASGVPQSRPDEKCLRCSSEFVGLFATHLGQGCSVVAAAGGRCRLVRALSRNQAAVSLPEEQMITTQNTEFFLEAVNMCASP
jgi:hypothetical protein